MTPVAELALMDCIWSETVYSVEVPAVDFCEYMLFSIDAALLSDLDLVIESVQTLVDIAVKAFVVSGLELFKLDS